MSRHRDFVDSRNSPGASGTLPYFHRPLTRSPWACIPIAVAIARCPVTAESADRVCLIVPVFARAYIISTVFVPSACFRVAVHTVGRQLGLPDRGPDRPLVQADLLAEHPVQGAVRAEELAHQRYLEAADEVDLPVSGVIGNGRSRTDNIRATYGNSESYRRRRLKRDRPDLFERVQRGETTAHAVAAALAGFVDQLAVGDALSATLAARERVVGKFPTTLKLRSDCARSLVIGPREPPSALSGPCGHPDPSARGCRKLRPA
jgi:hypothetical protein